MPPSLDLMSPHPEWPDRFEPQRLSDCKVVTPLIADQGLSGKSIDDCGETSCPIVPCINLWSKHIRYPDDIACSIRNGAGDDLPTLVRRNESDIRIAEQRR